MSDLRDDRIASSPTEVDARDDRSLGELIKEMTSELGNLFQKEIELAKLETKEEIGKAGKTGGMFAGAGVAAWLAVTFLSFAVAWALDNVMATWLAFLLVGVVYVAVAGVLFLKGREMAKTLNPVPEQTVETLKEDVQWAKAQKN